MNNTYSDITGTSLNFSGFNTLQGGAGSNEFDVYTTFSGSLHGGGTSAAPAVFNLYSGGSVGNGGSTGIVGQSGNSTINYFAAVTVTVSAFDTSSATPETRRQASLAASRASTRSTPKPGSTLTGDSNASTWDLGAATYKDMTAGTTSTLTFSGFGTLQGASSTSDTFNIDASSPLSLNLVGGSGNNDFVFTPGGTLNGTITGVPAGATQTHLTTHALHHPSHSEPGNVDVHGDAWNQRHRQSDRRHQHDPGWAERRDHLDHQWGE